MIQMGNRTADGIDRGKQFKSEHLGWIMTGYIQQRKNGIRLQ